MCTTRLRSPSPLSHPWIHAPYELPREEGLPLGLGPSSAAVQQDPKRRNGFVQGQRYPGDVDALAAQPKGDVDHRWRRNPRFDPHILLLEELVRLGPAPDL